MRHPNAQKRSQVQKSQAKTRQQRSPPLKRQNRKEILGKVMDHAHGAGGPANRNQVLSERNALLVSTVLDHLAQLHIVQDFKTQRVIRSDGLINISSDQIERAHAHVVLGVWVSYLPWAMTENKQRLEERDHHLLP